MRFLAFLIVAGVILSVARALTLVLILLLVVSLLWAVITRPFELLGFMTLSLAMEALARSPTTTVVCVALVATVIAVRSPSEKDG